MKTKTETFIVQGQHWNIDELIEELQKVRRKHNGDIAAELCGSLGFGYSIRCSWLRPKTEEEIKKEEEFVASFKEQEKEARRKQWEKLNEEFGKEGIRD